MCHAAERRPQSGESSPCGCRRSRAPARRERNCPGRCKNCPGDEKTLEEPVPHPSAREMTLKRSTVRPSHLRIGLGCDCVTGDYSPLDRRASTYGRTGAGTSLRPPERCVGTTLNGVRASSGEWPFLGSRSSSRSGQGASVVDVRRAASAGSSSLWHGSRASSLAPVDRPGSSRVCGSAWHSDVSSQARGATIPALGHRGLSLRAVLAPVTPGRWALHREESSRSSRAADILESGMRQWSGPHREEHEGVPNAAT